MEHDLTGKRVAILAADGFEQDELLIEEFAEGKHEGHKTSEFASAAMTGSGVD